MQDKLVFAIPPEILYLFEKCTSSKGHFQKAIFLKHIEVHNYFSLLRLKLATDLSDEKLAVLLFKTTIKNNQTTFVPKFCTVCGKFVTRISKSYPDTCSLKCTKNTSVAKEKASKIFSSKEFLEKRKETCLRKYGVEVTMRDPSIKAKYKKTIKEKYGAEAYTQTKDFLDKRHRTCLDKYGIEEPFAYEPVKTQALTNCKKSRMFNYYPMFVSLLKKKNIVPLVSQQEFSNIPEKISFKCLMCGHVWEREKDKEKYGYTQQHILCPNCCTHNRSFVENEVLFFLRQIYAGKIVTNAKNVIGRKELDIYLPEKHLAIEVNGSYYHTDKFKSCSYHQDKTKLCRKKGIRLIHVFEYEWVGKKEKLTAVIKNALGLCVTKIYARKCKVVSLSSSQYESFLSLNHLQGPVKSSLRLGLELNGELVAVIGFGKSRFKKGEVELHRFCVKAGYSVVGGFSKLIKHSEQPNFVSFVDLAHFSGEAYLKCGFKRLTVTKPSYVYVRQNTVLSRYQCQKHKLEGLLGQNYDPTLSESENMELNGWLKIYDCGNLKLCYEGGEE